VLEAIRHINTDVDLTPVLQAIREDRGQVDMPSLIEAVRSMKPEVDLSPVLAAVREKQESIKVEVDFSPVLQAIHESKLALDLSPILDAMAQIKTDVDMSLVLQAVQEQPEVDFSPVLEAIREKRDIDFEKELSPVIDAIRSSKRVSMDLSPVLDAIQQIELAVDFAPILQAIRENRIEPNFSKEASSIIDAIHAKQVDLAPVLQAIHESRVQPDFSKETAKILDAIRAKQMDLAPIFSEIQERTSGVALSQEARGELLAAIESSKAEVDFSALSRKVQETSARTTSDVIGEVRKLKAEIDFSDVFTSIRDCRNQISSDSSSLISALQRVRSELDNAPLQRAIQKVELTVADALRDVREEGRVEIDLAPVLAAVHAARTEVNLTPVLTEIRAVRNGGMDLSAAALRAIREITANRSNDTSEVINEIHASRAIVPRVDFSSVLAAIKETRGVLVSEVRKLKTEVNFTEVVREMEQTQAAVIHGQKAACEACCAVVVGEVQRVKAEIDFSEVLQAINKLACQLDWTALLQSVRQAASEQGEGLLSRRDFLMSMEELRGFFSLTRDEIRHISLHPDELRSVISAIAAFEARVRAEGSVPRAFEHVLAKLWELQQLISKAGTCHSEVMQDLHRMSTREDTERVAGQVTSVASGSDSSAFAAAAPRSVGQSLVESASLRSGLPLRPASALPASMLSPGRPLASSCMIPPDLSATASPAMDRPASAPPLMHTLPERGGLVDPTPLGDRLDTHQEQVPMFLLEPPVSVVPLVSPRSSPGDGAPLGEEVLE